MEETDSRGTMVGRKYYDLAIRAVCVYLKADGKSSSATSAITGIPTKTVTNLYRRACDRGFDLTARPLLMKDEFVADIPKAGRPKKQTSELT
ncbi:uncharacterized protein B0I36DRAFT_331045 [Microdochium trichocladiopsis]|uniref:Uncharacterized protein n=1 Tax=Microdochium trichocladiopsis TaxID=1682393 RepID=A0A9P8Y3Q9_9PEZI|nr:uncharacterized protein B0I36DRAFT_331045 [Microdochium trichocladiopsis]KAH7026632.1 hypothetical protein B0I36DRAFT_331045 [Microdochium trichocladiopsis]